MGYDQYTVPGNVAVEPTFVAILQHLQTYAMASRVILSNFFEKQLTQNHKQCLSGLSRAFFLTTFLEINVQEQFTVQARFPSLFRSQRGLISQLDDSRNRFTKSLYSLYNSFWNGELSILQLVWEVFFLIPQWYFGGKYNLWF